MIEPANLGRYLDVRSVSIAIRIDVCPGRLLLEIPASREECGRTRSGKRVLIVWVQGFKVSTSVSLTLVFSHGQFSITFSCNALVHVS